MNKDKAVCRARPFGRKKPFGRPFGNIIKNKKYIHLIIPVLGIIQKICIICIKN